MYWLHRKIDYIVNKITKHLILKIRRRSLCKQELFAVRTGSTVRKYEQNWFHIAVKSLAILRRWGTKSTLFHSAESILRSYQLWVTQELPSSLCNIHWSLSWARPIESTLPHSVSPRSALILSTPYVLIFVVVSFLSPFPPIKYTRTSPIRDTYPAHLILLNLIIQIILGDQQKLRHRQFHSKLECSLFDPW
jgi:hypothetical protein